MCMNVDWDVIFKINLAKKCKQNVRRFDMHGKISRFLISAAPKTKNEENLGKLGLGKKTRKTRIAGQPECYKQMMLV